MEQDLSPILSFLKSENSKPQRLHQVDGKWMYPELDDEKRQIGDLKVLPEELVPLAEAASRI